MNRMNRMNETVSHPRNLAKVFLSAGKTELSLVKELVVIQGSSVQVHSDDENKLKDLQRTSSSRRATCGAIVQHIPSLRILVVDDNRDGARSLEMLLRLIGNEVRTVYNGVEAIEATQAFCPEVILMDIGMPHMNGLEATKRIREQHRGKDIVIVALTGWGQDSDRLRTAEAGCNGHLVKPVDLPTLELTLMKARDSLRST